MLTDAGDQHISTVKLNTCLLDLDPVARVDLLSRASDHDRRRVLANIDDHAFADDFSEPVGAVLFGLFSGHDLAVGL